MIHLFKPGALYFDIGAHIGDKTKEFLVAGASKVIAVEPTPDLFQIVDPRVILVQKAVSNKQGRAKFRLSSHTTISSLEEKWHTQGRFAPLFSDSKIIIVETVTLNSLVDEYGLPDFCKIDVEGHEYAVLEGLSYPIPCLSFEFTAEFFEDAIRCLDWLEALSYRTFGCTINTQSCVKLDYGPAPRDKLQYFLEKECINKQTWGDIYAWL
jgi:FkbM family methyltransferase